MSYDWYPPPSHSKNYPRLSTSLHWTFFLRERRLFFSCSIASPLLHPRFISVSWVVFQISFSYTTLDCYRVRWTSLTYVSWNVGLRFSHRMIVFARSTRSTASWECWFDASGRFIHACPRGSQQFLGYSRRHCSIVAPFPSIYIEL